MNVERKNSSKDPKREHGEAMQDERSLFRHAMRGVKPLSTPPSPPRAPKPRPRARFRRLDEAAVLAESLMPKPGDSHAETGEEVSFRRKGISESILKKLRRGEYRIEAEVDLHGLNVTQAKQALRDFLQAMQRENARCVRIIHGKGRRSGNQGPVLKPTVQVVLQKVDAVVAYASARPMDGGTGAVYALLHWRA